jgi:hypothetical protein
VKLEYVSVAEYLNINTVQPGGVPCTITADMETTKSVAHSTHMQARHAALLGTQNILEKLIPSCKLELILYGAVLGRLTGIFRC